MERKEERKTEGKMVRKEERKTEGKMETAS